MNTKPCLDCGGDTSAIREYYMVIDAVWEAAGQIPLSRRRQQTAEEQETRQRAFLCIGCLESRIGRRLTADDFTDVSINRRGEYWYSARLWDRLGVWERLRRKQKESSKAN
jgi:hypothetical protein